jgi:hypothetical protein
MMTDVKTAAQREMGEKKKDIEMERNIVPVRELKGTRRKWNYFNKYKRNQKPSF